MFSSHKMRRISATVRAETLAELLGPAAILFAFAAVIGLFAAARFRWEEE